MSDIGVGNTLILDMEMPEEYRKVRRKVLREQAWLAILDEIILKPENKGKHVVIYFKDREERINYSSLEYQIEFEISFAREQQLSILKIEDLPTRVVFHSAVDELKYRIQAKWHKFWNTERVKQG